MAIFVDYIHQETLIEDGESLYNKAIFKVHTPGNRCVWCTESPEIRKNSSGRFFTSI